MSKLLTSWFVMYLSRSLLASLLRFLSCFSNFCFSFLLSVFSMVFFSFVISFRFWSQELYVCLFSWACLLSLLSLFCVFWEKTYLFFRVWFVASAYNFSFVSVSLTFGFGEFCSAFKEAIACFSLFILICCFRISICFVIFCLFALEMFEFRVACKLLSLFLRFMFWVW